MLDIGADESIMSQLSEYWEQLIAPELLRMQQEQFEATQQQQEQENWMGWLGLGLQGLGLVLSFIPGMQIFGAAAIAGGGLLGGMGSQNPAAEGYSNPVPG